MASPKLSFRVPEDTYTTLLKLAELERKTVTELTKELIEQGLGKRSTQEADLLEELRLMRTELWELAGRSVKTGAIAAYYARQAAIYTMEAMHYTTNNGQALPKEELKKRAEQWKEESRGQAKRMLEVKFEEM